MIRPRKKNVLFLETQPTVCFCRRLEIFLSFPSSVKIANLRKTRFSRIPVVPVFILAPAQFETAYTAITAIDYTIINMNMAASLIAIHVEKCEHITAKRSVIKTVERVRTINAIMEDLHPYEKGFVIKAMCSVSGKLFATFDFKFKYNFYTTLNE